MPPRKVSKCRPWCQLPPEWKYLKGTIPPCSKLSFIDLFQIGYLWRICPQAKYRNQLVDGGKSGRPSSVMLNKWTWDLISRWIWQCWGTSDRYCYFMWWLISFWSRWSMEPLDLRRYQENLVCEGVHLPDPRCVPGGDWKDDHSQLPKVTFTDIYIYLINSKGKYTSENCPCNHGTYAKETLAIGLQHTFSHPRPGVPVSSCVHGAVSREPSARFSAHIQSASSNFPHCSTLIGHELKIGLSAGGAVNTAHISVTCPMR